MPPSFPVRRDGFDLLGPGSLPRSRKQPNYFVRHWRGELGLGISYWGNGFLAGLVVALAARAAAVATVTLKTQAILGILILVLAVVASVWHLVGVWRSASHHYDCGGRRFWAGLAKVMVVLGFLSTGVVIWKNYIPQTAEMLRIVAGDNGMPAYRIQVLPGASAIEFRGGLRAGCAAELDRIVSAVPQAKVLQIESSGGRIAEAREMMRIVRQHKLTTYTSECCLSAATLVLLAGEERVVADNARIGFHAGYFPGLTKQQLQEGNLLMRSTMESAGVTRPFIDRVLATPSEKMWYPTFEEMRANGVVTARSKGNGFVATRSQRANVAPASAISTGLATANKTTGSAPPTYRVCNLRAGEVLKMRAGPGTNFGVVAAVPQGTHGITLGHKRAGNGATMWQEIIVRGRTGWVNEIYIEPEWR